MNVLQRMISILDPINEYLGRAIATLALVLAAIVFAIVALRYGFHTSNQWLSESMIYAHGMLFMLGMGYTLRHDGHVRVDVLSRHFSPRGAAWRELFGTIFLLFPVSLFLLIMSINYVAASWSIHEGSMEPGGIPYLYLLKTLLIIMPILLMIQGLTEALRAIEILRQHHPDLPDHPDTREGV
ncbi:MAG TPA: TRAP transporter small permease subunit [Halothiobacillus sp.]|nr:TRAP transporter small permease subunit [Halothiobacillus sp.]